MLFRSANVDVPWVWWAALSLVFYVRIWRGGSTVRDWTLLGVSASLALCTKDQAYALYPLVPVAVVGRIYREHRDAGAANPLSRALTDRRLWSAAAAAALPAAPARVFLAVGRKQLAAFAGQPQHHYLLRLVDAPAAGSLPLPHTTVVLGRGPFSAADDTALLRTHGIEWVVAKNAGGEATRGKLDAARALGLPVVMVQRPALPQRDSTESVAAVLHWIAHGVVPPSA